MTGDNGRSGSETLARPTSASVNVGDQTAELPIVRGSEGDDAADIGQLRTDTGLVTFDPGYKNTAAATSAITFLDGEAGILRYRGYQIEQVAARSSFLETSYLLIYGKLPSQA
jgi:citrate synthase